MKTINEGLDNAYKKAGHNAYFGNGFNAGVEFAQRWIPIEEETPLACETGNWDGKRSDYVLAKNIHGNVFLTRTYEGILDGHKYCDFVDRNDSVLSNITHWRPIEYK